MEKTKIENIETGILKECDILYKNKTRLELVVEKTTFSCGGSKKFIKVLKSLNRSQIIITGIEAHVCVLQTAIDLKGMNYHSFVVEDAISSRVKKSKDIAKKRLGNNGCDLVSTEMIVFEWIKDSGDQNFKKISRLIV